VVRSSISCYSALQQLINDTQLTKQCEIQGGGFMAQFATLK